MLIPILYGTNVVIGIVNAIKCPAGSKAGWICSAIGWSMAVIAELQLGGYIQGVVKCIGD